MRVCSVSTQGMLCSILLQMFIANLVPFHWNAFNASLLAALQSIMSEQ
jgi:hypothetical protein